MSWHKNSSRTIRMRLWANLNCLGFHTDIIFKFTDVYGNSYQKTLKKLNIVFHKTTCTTLIPETPSGSTKLHSVSRDLVSLVWSGSSRQTNKMREAMPRETVRLPIVNKNVWQAENTLPLFPLTTGLATERVASLKERKKKKPVEA